MRTILKTLLAATAALLTWQGAAAQHTLGFVAGYGMASGRLDPTVEKRALWGKIGRAHV